MDTPKVGDTWIPDPEHFDCPAIGRAPGGWAPIAAAACLRPAGHDGPHIAVDEDMIVVKVWA